MVGAARANESLPVRPLPRSQNKEFNVHVVVRFRPPVTLDEQQDRHAFIVHSSGRSVDSVDYAYHFELDRAFSEDTSQEAVYEHVGRPIVADVLDGYNGTIFAYGHTGSGKTYCMFGSEGHRHGTQCGIVPRTAQQIFDYLAECADDRLEFTLRCSFLEVYREQMRDLLDPTNQALSIKDLPQRGLFVDGLTREYVTCAAEVLDVLRQGYLSRAVARTRLNEYSSRSHAIFVLHVEQRAPEGTERLGKLTLVDLAGSEKVGKSGAVGETLEEAKKINWSLSALGKVIDALAERKPHVPYRDSRLTRVLQEALGGNCRTTLLVAASACSQHFDETLSSMRFATRAKKVRNHAKVNYMYSSDQLLHLVAKLQRELASAHTKIEHLSGVAETRGHGRESSRKAPPERHRRSSDPGVDWHKSAAPGQDTRMRLKLPLDSLQGNKLGHSGSAPSLNPIKSGNGDEERGPRDIDEALLPLSDATSCGSARSFGLQDDSDENSHCGEQQPSAEFLAGDIAAAFQDDEAWRPLAVAARDAVRSLEAALVEQEKALEQAGLLRTLRDKHGVEARSSSGDSGPGLSADTTAASAIATRDTSSDAWDIGLDAGQMTGERSATSTISERWRTLRHAVDARSLHWRLQLERHRSEELALELEMRKRHAEELERTADKTSARLARLLQDGIIPGDGDAASGMTSPQETDIHNLLNFVLKRDEEFSPGRPRIARPVRCGTARGSKAVPPGPPLVRQSSAGQRQGAPTRAGSANTSPTSDVEAFCEDAMLCGEGSWGCSFATSAWATASQGSMLSDDTPLVAGTGDVGDTKFRRQSSGSVKRYVTKNQEGILSQLEGLRLEHSALQSENANLRAKMNERSSQLVALAAELSSKDVRLSALQHEVRVKDALLSYLREDSLKKAAMNDDEIERLVEQAMNPLTTFLTTRQATLRSQMSYSPSIGPINMAPVPLQPMPLSPLAY